MAKQPIGIRCFPILRKQENRRDPYDVLLRFGRSLGLERSKKKQGYQNYRNGEGRILDLGQVEPLFPSVIDDGGQPGINEDKAK